MERSREFYFRGPIRLHAPFGTETTLPQMLPITEMQEIYFYRVLFVETSIIVRYFKINFHDSGHETGTGLDYDHLPDMSLQRISNNARSKLAHAMWRNIHHIP